ncbi:hypothetical protein BLOT_010358 [Blomia tropicalis]|nr:hypothetical protein BLOT_010358 [Blomia tropicalis]
MGQTFSEPVTEKESSTDRNETFHVSSSSIQGWRISMEDAHTILLSMPNDPSASFFAVFDGHGGAKVANYAAENLYKCVNTNPLYVEGRYEEALKDAFVEFDKAMFNDEKMRDELAGSTAVIILVKDGNIYCANIGDSRAVASFAGNVDPLSFDHKPTGQIEMNRIVSAGGWVQFNRVNGNLALSRAFGDFVFKRNEKRSVTEQIVIALPDVQQRPLSDELEFIVLACDGVWDVMTNDEVVEFVRRRIIYRVEPVSICEELITRCLAPDCQMGSGIGCDNMTVILICYLNGTDYETFCERVTACSPLGIPPPPPGVDEATVRRFFGNRVSHNNNNDLAQAAPAVVIGNSNENNGASTSGNVSSEQVSSQLNVPMSKICLKTTAGQSPSSTSTSAAAAAAALSGMVCTNKPSSTSQCTMKQQAGNNNQDDDSDQSSESSSSSTCSIDDLFHIATGIERNADGLNVPNNQMVSTTINLDGNRTTIIGNISAQTVGGSTIAPAPPAATAVAANTATTVTQSIVNNNGDEQTIQSVRCVTVESLTIPSVMETMDDDNKKANEMEQTNLKMELNSSGDANTK